MRKSLIFLLCFAMMVMAAGGVSASTDCERWLADYKRALAEKPTTQKLLAAKHRARVYTHRTIAQMRADGTPVPHPVRLASTRPHLTPAQMVKRFDVLCGALPMDPQVLDARMAPDEFISEMSLGGPVDAESVPDDTMIAENNLPTYDGPSATPATTTGGYFAPTYGPVFGGGMPGLPGALPPSSPATTPIPPAAPVPEPGSWVLLGTGALGAAGLLRRRLAATAV